MPPKPKQSKRIQSVDRSLDLLEALALREEVGLVELSTQVQLGPSTAHRILATLVARGYVTQNPDTGRYLLSYKVHELAGYSSQRVTHLRALARPHLEDVCRVVGETTKLVLLDGVSIVYIDHVESSRSVRGFARIGQSLPAHATASGKAMLAFHDSESVAAVMEQDSFGQQLTPNTLSSETDFREALERIRRSGYSIDNEEHEEGVICAAATVLDYQGMAAAAISVSGPADRMRRADPDKIGAILRAHALDISRQLGYQQRSLDGSSGVARRARESKRLQQGGDA
jgi:IclR family acetate operon transcriptional repressor